MFYLFTYSFIFQLTGGSCYVTQAAIELLGYRDPPASASRVAGAIDLYQGQHLALVIGTVIRFNHSTL
jgi:hypothetical protein